MNQDDELDARRQYLEIVRLTQSIAFSHYELEPDNTLRKDAEAQGYRYIKVTVTDVESGNAIAFPFNASGQHWALGDGKTHHTSFYTMRQGVELTALGDALRALLAWPIELLDSWQAIAHVDGNQVTEAHHTARQIESRQLMGGRPKGDGEPSEATAEQYRKIAALYYEACRDNPELTQVEFCKKQGIDRRKLGRALAFVSKNTP